MPRNLVICCDGTNNSLDSPLTNVAHLSALADIGDAARQLAYYDAGVGVEAHPNMRTRIGAMFSKWSGSAFGTGLVENVQNAYSHLVDNYSDGDHVYLFGFSRGAYTVRVIADLLHNYGLLRREHADEAASVVKAFQDLYPRDGSGFVNGLPLVVFDDFEQGNADRWEQSAPEAWSLNVQGENHVYSQFKHVVTKTPVRSPFNRALIKDLYVSDCVLDVKLQSTVKDYAHRSLCLFFGYQDPAHMYYVHFGQKTDDHANQIFIVNAAPRTKISTKSTDGTPWDNAWHHARIMRSVATGSIEVYFDNMDEPVMTATDTTFTWGEVGIGSFDDTGNFDSVRLLGKVATPASLSGR